MDEKKTALIFKAFCDEKIVSQGKILKASETETLMKKAGVIDG